MMGYLLNWEPDGPHAYKASLLGVGLLVYQTRNAAGSDLVWRATGAPDYVTGMFPDAHSAILALEVAIIDRIERDTRGRSVLVAR